MTIEIIKDVEMENPKRNVFKGEQYEVSKTFINQENRKTYPIKLKNGMDNAVYDEEIKLITK